MNRFAELLDRLMPSDMEPGDEPRAVAKAEMPGQPATKRFLMAVAWAANDIATEKRKAIDTSGWVLDATDASTLAQQLRANIDESGASVADLFELFNWMGAGRGVSDTRARANSP